MDKLLTLLNTYLQAATAVITKFAPAAWNATLEMIRISCAFDLATRLAGTLFLIAIPITLSKVIRPTEEVSRNEFDKRDKKILITLVSVGVAVISFVIWATSFTDWLGVLAPQLYLLYHAAVKVHLMN